VQYDFMIDSFPQKVKPHFVLNPVVVVPPRAWTACTSPPPLIFVSTLCMASIHAVQGTVAPYRLPGVLRVLSATDPRQGRARVSFPACCVASGVSGPRSGF
jgi:hypothetical protein